MSIIQEVKLLCGGGWHVKAIRKSLDDKTSYYVYFGGQWLLTKANQLPQGAYAALRRALNKGQGMKTV